MTTQTYRLIPRNPDYPLAGKSETLTLPEWKRVYGYFPDILAMHGATLAPAPQPEQEQQETAAPVNVGDRVEAGELGTDDHDTGRVDEIDADGMATVSWDSLVVTTYPAADLRKL